MEKSVQHPLVEKAKKVFTNKNFYQCHKDMEPVLREMALDTTFWEAVVEFNFGRTDFLNSQLLIPVFDYKMVEERNFLISAHCWLPWADGAINRSANWIHHHDNSLLTSINAFGKGIGYHSFNFNKDYKLDKLTKKVSNLKVTKDFHHPYLNIEFCDGYVPHVVFKPAELMITYALWSFDKPVKLDKLRSIPILHAMRNPLKKIIGLLKAEKVLDIETETSDRQFAPINGSMECVGNIQYPSDKNEYFLQNALWMVQETGITNPKILKNIHAQLVAHGKTSAALLAEKLIAGEKISMYQSPMHINNPGINFTLEDMLAAVSKSQ